MSVEVKYNFDDPQNFDFDTETVEIVDSEAKLKLANNPDQTFNQDFSDDTGFTYDSDKAEFTEPSPGVYRVEQKNARPQDASWGATYSTDINANWGDVPTLIPVSTRNDPQVIDGRLVLITDKNVIYNSKGAINPIRGAMRMKFTPGYDLIPPNQQGLFHYATPNASSANNRFYLDHTTGGVLSLTLLTRTGGNMGSANFGTWNPDLGTEYELEINWDFTPGSEAIRFFIDGVQQGSTLTNSGDRDDDLDINSQLRVGGAVDSRYFVSDFVVFSEVQHTANYTPGYTLPETNYVEVPVEFPPFGYPGQGAIQLFQEIANVASGDGKYIINGRWYDGGNWVISDGSYAQSNTVLEINANLASSPVANSIIMTLVFPGSNTQSWVQDFTFTYTGQQYINGSTVIPNMGIPVTALLQFIDETILPANTEIRYTIEVNGTLYWFNGGSWVVSDQTQGQTNTAADVNDNADTLPLSESGEFIRPKIYFYTDGSATPSIQSLCMFVIYDVNPIDRPGTTLIFGSLLDMIAEPMIGRATLRVVNESQFFIEGNSIQPDSVQAEANDEGLAIVQVIKTASINHQYAFFIDYVNQNNQNRSIALGRSIAPDDQASNIANLTFS